MRELTLTSVIARIAFTLIFALVPAALLGQDFGFSVGLGYFVVAATLLSIHYDVAEAVTALKVIATRKRD